MKKLLSVILGIALLCSLIVVVNVSAAPDYTQLFEDAIGDMRWAMRAEDYNAEVAEGENFSVITMLETAKRELEYDYYTGNAQYTDIPASVVEAYVSKVFAKYSQSYLRSCNEAWWDEYNVEPIPYYYDAQNNVYRFCDQGGMGDSTIYVVAKYVKSGNKYTVYSNFIEQGEWAQRPANAVEGKDYIVYEGANCEVLHRLKTVVETDGTYVKFHSWQKVAAIPEDTPDNNEDDTPSVSTPSQSTPSQSTPSESTPAESTPSEGASEQKPTVTVAEQQGIKLEAEATVFPENTVVKVEKIEKAEKIEQITVAVRDIAEKFVAYEITAECDNVEVQPDGKVVATFEIPEGFRTDRIAVLYVSDDGKTERLESKVNEETKTVEAALSHFSTYLVAEVNESEVISNVDEDEAESGNTWVWVVIAVAVLLAAGGTAFYFFYFKKKQGE